MESVGAGTQALGFGGGSPVGERSVENPLFRAEFRRWRARPLFYSGLGIVATVLIAYIVHQQRGGAVLARGTPNAILDFLQRTFVYVVRPSSIVPAIMVWRALYSFREGPFYEPFRVTFLRPGQFLWGVIAVPCLVSALILTAYTVGFLGPGVYQRWPAAVYPPEFRWICEFMPPALIVSIIVDGVVNGFFVALVTAHAGIKYRLSAASLALAASACVVVQALNSYLAPVAPEISMWIARQYPGNMGVNWILPSLLPYYLYSIPKLALCVFIWRRCVRSLAVCVEESRPR